MLLGEFQLRVLMLHVGKGLVASFELVAKLNGKHCVRFYYSRKVREKNSMRSHRISTTKCVG